MTISVIRGSLEFEQKFLAATDGAGVDVVLNSLAGEFLDASLRLLVRGGRFIEMGKTDIRDPQQVAADHPGVVYRAFDLIEAGPDRTAAMLAQLMGLFGAGVLAPLPVKAFDVRCASAAYRFVSQARQIGKVVLTLPDGPGDAVLAGCRWRAGRGQRDDHRGYRDGRFGAGRPSGGPLWGGARGVGQPQRRAMPRASRSWWASCEDAGAQVSVAACDVADRDAVAALIAQLPAEYPLKGVFHAAGGARRRVDRVVDAGAGGYGVAGQSRWGLESA